MPPRSRHAALMMFFCASCRSLPVLLLLATACLPLAGCGYAWVAAGAVLASEDDGDDPAVGPAILSIELNTARSSDPATSYAAGELSFDVEVENGATGTWPLSLELYRNGQTIPLRSFEVDGYEHHPHMVDLDRYASPSADKENIQFRVKWDSMPNESRHAEERVPYDDAVQVSASLGGGKSDSSPFFSIDNSHAPRISGVAVDGQHLPEGAGLYGDITISFEIADEDGPTHPDFHADRFWTYTAQVIFTYWTGEAEVIPTTSGPNILQIGDPALQGFTSRSRNTTLASRDAFPDQAKKGYLEITVTDTKSGPTLRFPAPLDDGTQPVIVLDNRKPSFLRVVSLDFVGRIFVGDLLAQNLILAGFDATRIEATTGDNVHPTVDIITTGEYDDQIQYVRFTLNIPAGYENRPIHLRVWNPNDQSDELYNAVRPSTGTVAFDQSHLRVGGQPEDVAFGYFYPEPDPEQGGYHYKTLHMAVADSDSKAIRIYRFEENWLERDIVHVDGDSVYVDRDNPGVNGKIFQVALATPDTWGRPTIAVTTNEELLIVDLVPSVNEETLTVKHELSLVYGWESGYKRRLTTGDIDRDGRDDIMVYSKTDERDPVRIFYGLESPRSVADAWHDGASQGVPLTGSWPALLVDGGAVADSGEKVLSYVLFGVSEDGRLALVPILPGRQLGKILESKSLGGGLDAIALGNLDGRGGFDMAVSLDVGAKVWLSGDSTLVEAIETLDPDENFELLPGNGDENGDPGMQGDCESVAIGNIDGVGWDDVVASYEDDSTVAFFLNTGDAANVRALFDPYVLPVGKKCQGVFLHDFNDDGFSDVAVISEDEYLLSLFRGRAAGPPQPFFSARLPECPPSADEKAPPSRIVFGDFSTESPAYQEAAILSGSGDCRGINLFTRTDDTNASDPRWALSEGPLYFDEEQGFPTAMAVSRGNGVDDIITACEIVDTLTGSAYCNLLRIPSRGDGTLASPEPLVDDSREGTAVSLLSRFFPDKNLLVLCLNRGTEGELVIYEAVPPGSGSYTLMAAKVLPGEPLSCVLHPSQTVIDAQTAATDPEGILAVTIDRGNGTAAVLAMRLEPTSGALSDPAEVPLSVTPSIEPLHTAVADINADGVPDVAMLVKETIFEQERPEVQVFLGRRSDTENLPWFFDLPREFPLADYYNLEAKDAESITDLELDDFNGDGLPDLLLANVSSGDLVEVWIFRGRAAPLFDRPFGQRSSVVIGSRIQGLTVADFNGDGSPDLGILDDPDPALLLGADPTFFGLRNVTGSHGPPVADGLGRTLREHQSGRQCSWRAQLTDPRGKHR